MQIRETSIELPTDHVNNRLKEPYFEKNFGSVAGSFDPQTFLVSALPIRAEKNADGRVTYDSYDGAMESGLAARANERQRTDFLIQQTTFAHEVCHFHDFTCTSAGFLCFAREWGLVYSIYAAIKELKLKGWSATDSLGRMYIDERRAEVETVFNLYLNLMTYRIIGFGDLAWIEVSPSAAEYDVVWGSVTIGSTTARLPLFPTRMSVDGQQRCFLVPIGFRALTECRALLHQWLAMRSYGQHYVDNYRTLLGAQLEYRVVNMLFTRVLKNNGHDPNASDWASGELFRILSAVLSRSSGTLEASIGGVLVEEMRRVDPSTGRYPGTHSDNMQHMVQAKGEAMRGLLPDFRGEWHGYQMRDFAIRCFEQALEAYSAPNEADIPWEPDSLEWYAFFNWKLPQPPISTQGTDLGFLPTLSTAAVAGQAQLVGATILFRSLLEQAMWQKPLICPALRGAYSGFLQRLELHDHCAEGLRARDCGRFGVGDDVSAHWNCPWKAISLDLGFARGARATGESFP